jgi:hypothetical protein
VRCYVLAGAIGDTREIPLGFKGCYGVGGFYKTSRKGSKWNLTNDLQAPANSSEMLVQKRVKGVNVLGEPIQTIGNGVTLVLYVQGQAFEAVLTIKKSLNTSDSGCDASVEDRGDGLLGFLLEVDVDGAYKGQRPANSGSNGTGWPVGDTDWFGRKLNFNTL